MEVAYRAATDMVLPSQKKPVLAAQLPWNPTVLLLALLGCEVILVILDLIAFNVFEARRLKAIFDITLESNIPTFFSSTQAMLVGVGCLLLFGLYAGSDQPRWRIYGWLTTALFFFVIAVDDASQFHERVATVWSASLKDAAEPSALKGWVESFRSYYWQLLILPFFILGGIAVVVFVFRELGGLRQAWPFLAGIGFFAVAVLLDYFDALEEVYEPSIDVFGSSFAAVRHGFRAVEEVIEMFGTSCILIAVLNHYVMLTAEYEPEPGYGRAIPIAIAVVGGIAVAAMAALVVSWVGIRNAPPVVERVEAPAKPELRSVAADSLGLDGLVLGMTQAEVRKAAGKLRIRLKPAADRPDIWTFTQRKRRAISEADLMFVDNTLVGIKLRFVEPRPELHESFTDALGEPYRVDDIADHWQTQKLKAKANRDGSKAYVVRREHRRDFSWSRRP